MTRPLRYDDSFINILKEKMHDKFFYFFTVKVQSTTFFQKFNLQKGLLITSLYDIIFGLIVFILLIKNFDNHVDDNAYILQNVLCILSIFFGFIGLDTSLNLKKIHSLVYKNWRFVFIIAFFLLELMNNFSFCCYYTEGEISENFKLNMNCSIVERLVFNIVLLSWNIYITKIAWSFNIRLEQSHDLLIIHGGYLEKLLGDVKPEIKVEKLKNNNPFDTNTNSGRFSTGNKDGKGSSEDLKLFTKETQITSGGNIRDSLKKDLNENKIL